MGIGTRDHNVNKTQEKSMPRKTSGRKQKTKKKARQHGGPRTQNWETPDYFIAAIVADSYGGKPFRLDAAASPKNAKAPIFYTKKQDGLSLAWLDRTYCNPPYKNQDEWLLHASEQARKNSVRSSCLVLNSTSALYWLPLALERGTVDYVIGRLSFIHPRTRKPVHGNSYANAVVHFGPGFHPGVTRYRMADTGRLVVPAPGVAFATMGSLSPLRIPGFGPVTNMKKASA